MRNFNRREALALAAAGTTASLGTTVFSQTRPKIAFLLNGNPGELGWNFEHERGIQLARDTFGDAVQIDSIFGVGEWGNGDASEMINLIVQGYDLIFACSFGYGQSVVQIALASPQTKFEHCGGYVRPANVSTYSAKWYEGRMPQGLMAGAMTETNRVGYLGSFPIPQVIRGINAAFLAARSVNPAVEFDVVWLNTWFSPPEEEAAARALMADGADVLLAHTNTTKPVEVAQELGGFGFGQASDMTSFGPDATLSATINNWGPYYVRRIRAFLDGTWESQDTWGGFDEEMIAMGPLASRIPAANRARVDAVVAGMESQLVSPFVGPINKQDGSPWLRAGEVATEHDLLTMGFFVEGITSEIPQRG